MGGPLARVLFAALAVAAAIAVPASASDFVGMYNDDAFYGSPSYRSSVFTFEAAIGVQIVRQPFDWNRIEIAPGDYDFRDYDDFVLRAATAGIQVLPVLGNPPSFRASGYTRDDFQAPPASNADFGAFAAKLVQRYGPDGTIWAVHPGVPKLPIRSWQIWNEPNLPMFWNTGPDPASYTAMLRAAHDAIHAVDPRAEVVAAGLPNSKVGISLTSYLDGMFAAGAHGAFDTMAIHPYALNATRSLDLVVQTRALLSSRGDSSPIWITEDGWPTDGPLSPYTVDEAGQAANLTDLIAQVGARRAELGIRGVIIFRWRDAVSTFDAWPLHAGLVRADGSAKPGLAAFRDAVAALNAAPATGGDPGVTSAPSPRAPTAVVPSGPAVVLSAPRGRIAISRGKLSRYGFLRVHIKCLAAPCNGTLRTRKKQGACTGSRRFKLEQGAARVLRVPLRGTRRQLRSCKRVPLTALTSRA